MALNSSKLEVIEHRRRLVAQLRLRGKTQRQIAEHIANLKIVNPDTGQPFSLGTINSDIKALREEWRQEAVEDTAKQKGELWAQLREVRRVAWERTDLDTILKSVKQEADLLGVNSPVRHEHAGKDGKAIETKTDVSFDLSKLSTTQLDALIRIAESLGSQG